MVSFGDDAEGCYHATAKDDKEAGELVDQGSSTFAHTARHVLFRKRKKKKKASDVSKKRLVCWS